LILDEIDEKVLQEYTQDSRRSYREIARKVGIAPGTVVARMKKLEEEGIVKKYTIQLDSEKLGYDLTAVIECIVSEGMMLEAAHEITKIKSTRAIYNITGDSDVLIIGKFKNRDELSRFTKKILQLPNVERTKTHLALNILKEDFNEL
jgi:DNA-binding Lrp family transcriptional regulator